MLIPVTRQPRPYMWRHKLFNHKKRPRVRSLLSRCYLREGDEASRRTLRWRVRRLFRCRSSAIVPAVQVGAITLTNQITSSLLQPLVGYYSDKHPRPYGLVVGMCFTLTGLLLLSVANRFPAVLLSVAFVGVGSSVLHPESSKVARLASGGAKGMAQSVSPMMMVSTTA